MLSDTERGVLSRLSEFSEEIEASWDVPRALSLPGLADSLGLVRSSLNKPLSKLEEEGLVFTRVAHVIGGGSRKRKVIHITSLGREMVNTFENNLLIKNGKLFGTFPDISKIFGRENDKQILTKQIFDGNSIFLSGLPGIGKTSLVRNIVPEILEFGWTVRWATCYSNTDISDIALQWTEKKSLRDISSLSSYCGKNKNLLIIDEIQEVHPRHIDSIGKLLNQLKDSRASILVIVRSPNPLNYIEGFSEHRLLGLDEIEGKNLLPKDIDQVKALEIVSALGGHPLALHLWSPESELPEEVEAVQNFVESNVISKLTRDALLTLDELSLSPIPLDVNEI
jgi:DNA-binding MarR family transcriptional regulator